MSPLLQLVTVVVGLAELTDGQTVGVTFGTAVGRAEGVVVRSAVGITEGLADGINVG